MKTSGSLIKDAAVSDAYALYAGLHHDRCEGPDFYCISLQNEPHHEPQLPRHCV